jgi:hypothetical protein
MTDKVYPPSAPPAEVPDVEANTTIRVDALLCIPADALMITTVIVFFFYAAFFLTVVLAAVIVFARMVYEDSFVFEPLAAFEIFSKVVLVVFYFIPGTIFIVVCFAILAAIKK